MDGGDASGWDALRARGQEAGKHPHGQDRDAATTGDGPLHEVGLAEHEQRLDRESNDALNSLALSVGLLEHRLVDPVWINPTGVGFRLDREQSSRADQNVVNVAATSRRVVDRKPALFPQAIY